MIGVFDSGLGGLDIYKKIKELLPNESLFYYADNKNSPYGNKTKTEIKTLSLKAVKYLEKKGCNIIVIACNTATTSGIDYFRKNSKAKIIGVVPVIKTAAQITNNKKIALLATPFTVKSLYVNKLIKKFALNCQIKKIPCADWVEAIENKSNKKNNITDKLLNNCLEKIKSEDTIILGCTHFSLIKNNIQRLVGPDKKVIDSTEAVARHVLRIGLKHDLLNKTKLKPKYIFDCSGNKQKFQKQIKKYVQ